AHAKNARCAVPRRGASQWACLPAPTNTCNFPGVGPKALFPDVLTMLVTLWPASRLDDLCPGPGRLSAPPSLRPETPSEPQPRKKNQAVRAVQAEDRLRFTGKAIETLSVDTQFYWIEKK